MSRQVRVVGAVAPEIVTRVAHAAKLDTLAEVLRWGGEVVDVVVQDEYTHDIVASARSAFLVFDTT
jgi:hypothetical protein